MENNSNNQLDTKIKESLSKYLASKEASDWARMETMLDAAPISSSFKWKYVLNLFIVLAVAGGGYLFYTHLNTPKAEVKSGTIAPESPAVPMVAPTVAPTVAPIETDTKTTTPVAPEVEIKKEDMVKKENNTTEKSINKTEEKNTEDKEVNTVKDTPPQIYIMGNEPVFGDMLDSSKGIVGETKEKEETKKAAIEHSENSIGWSKIINQDSLKKANTEKKKNHPKKNNK